MNQEKAAELASRLALAYPGRAIDLGHLASWTEELEQLEESVAVEAVRRLRHEVSDPPSVAVLLEVIAEVRRESIAVAEPLALPSVEGIPMPDDVKAKLRAIAEREVDEDAAETEWKRKVAAAARSTSPVRSCSGFGAVPVGRDGQLVCPDCGVEVPDRKVRMPRRREVIANTT